MNRIRELFRRIADWTEGKKTHLANVTTFGVLLWLWHKGTIPGPEAVALAGTTAFSSLFRLVANEPGALSRAATLPEATDLKVAVRESQVVDIVKNDNIH